MFVKSFQRPKNYFYLLTGRQWQIDKELDILDWKGGCAHDINNNGLVFCKKCQERYNEHYEV